MIIPANVREFLEEPHLCVMATINRDGTPQLTAMWYDIAEGHDIVILNTTRGLLKERNIRRDARVAICVEQGMRYVTLSGMAELIEDRTVQEKEVNRLAIRYVGTRLGPHRWERISQSDRIGVHLHVTRVHARGFA